MEKIKETEIMARWQQRIAEIEEKMIQKEVEKERNIKYLEEGTYWC